MAAAWKQQLLPRDFISAGRALAGSAGISLFEHMEQRPPVRGGTAVLPGCAIKQTG